MKTNSYYNPAQLRKFQEHGVIIPDLSSVRIGREVAFDKIAAGSTLQPFVRINGSNTEIHAGANIGLFGPVTLDNSWIGENAVIGSLGAVTLKDTVVGPESILGSGVAEQAVLLGKKLRSMTSVLVTDSEYAKDHSMRKMLPPPNTLILK